MDKGVPFRLSKNEKKRICGQLQDMFKDVPVQVISRVVGGCGSFDEALERVLAVAEKHQTPPPEEQLHELFPHSSVENVARCLALSAGNVELAVDLLSSVCEEESKLERSVSDLCEAFDMSRDEAHAELRACGNVFEDAALSILHRSTGGMATNDGENADLAFLKAMFQKESEDVLQGLLDEMKRLEDVVDFLLSLDVLLVEEAINAAEEPRCYSPEEELLSELFPHLDSQTLVAALEACNWDANEACAVLAAAQQQEKTGKLPVQQQQQQQQHVVKQKGSKRWQKLEAKQMRQGPSMRWNGTNGIVRECLVERKSIEETASEKSSPVKPSVTFASHEGEQYEGHVFTHGRYAEATISAADLVDESAVAKVAQLHQQNRRRYAYLAANAYRAGDSQAAKKFSQLAEKEERLQGLWSARITGKTRRVDLHGFFVKEAMQICGNVLGSCVPGETVTFITGRGAHSEGGVPRIRNALVAMLGAMTQSCTYRINVGEVIVQFLK